MSDLYQYNWMTFRAMPNQLPVPMMITTEALVDEFIGKLRRRNFRGMVVLGMDVEGVDLGRYTDWPRQQKQYEPGYPTHTDLTGFLCRWLILANPYGLVGIIDGYKMTKGMWSKLVNFWKSPQVLLVAFDAQQDLWSVQRTFSPCLYKGYVRTKNFCRNTEGTVSC